MAIDATSSTTATTTTKTAATTTTTTDADAASLNYDSFLKLLIAQMKNQDPTDPMDSSEQVAQLATFSQVEQAIKTNTNLTSMLQSQSLSQAADYIGKTITSADKTMTGVVKEVQVYSDGVLAVTTAGDKILIAAGITVSAPAATTTDTTTGS
jgi:flagellar basal-body rod modification protein FlgD